MIGTKILEERRSKYNGKLRVVKTWGMGTYIQADGLTQSGGIVTTIWKKTLSKIRNTKHEIRNVLILGLGGGTVVKLIHKNWPMTKIIGVDIDPTMIELGKKYLSLDKVKINIKIQDAEKVVPGKFDLVIVDLYNGDKFPKKFEKEKFIKRLSKYPLVVFNRLYLKNKKVETDVFGQKLEKIFKNVVKFCPQANLMFVCYSEGT
ncbi:MAG TPA: methyltransferase domain-containing protein [Patescibacteria group bacterium]|nr:methyltransferase domain-containing protein [Patescibacteria group bacterium]